MAKTKVNISSRQRKTHHRVDVLEGMEWEA